MSDLDCYARVAAHGDVLGVGVGAQPAEWVERLGTDYVDDAGGGLLRRDYGLLFEDLVAAITALGCSVEPDDDGTAADFRRYRVPESGVRILVRVDAATHGAAGHVWNLSVSPAWWRET